MKRGTFCFEFASLEECLERVESQFDASPTEVGKLEASIY